MASPEDVTILPPNLPAPVDDGACDHLRGARMPTVALPSTDGGQVRVDKAAEGFRLLVLFAFPKMSPPGTPSPEGWDLIPGARGCTPETCGFRDLAAEFGAAGIQIAGLSTQDTNYQREAVQRLQLNFPLLSDAAGVLRAELRLPTFRIAGEILLRRLTLVVRNGQVARVFYPVFPPDRHASEVLQAMTAWPGTPRVATDM